MRHSRLLTIDGGERSHVATAALSMSTARTAEESFAMLRHSCSRSSRYLILQVTKPMAQSPFTHVLRLYWYSWTLNDLFVPFERLIGTKSTPSGLHFQRRDSRHTQQHWLNWRTDPRGKPPKRAGSKTSTEQLLLSKIVLRIRFPFASCSCRVPKLSCLVASSESWSCRETLTSTLIQRWIPNWVLCTRTKWVNELCSFKMCECSSDFSVRHWCYTFSSLTPTKRRRWRVERGG